MDELKRVPTDEVRKQARQVLSLEAMASAVCGPDAVAKRVA